MKKIILLLLLTNLCYSQKSFDDILKDRLEEFKKTPMIYDEQRPIMISALDKIISAAKDSLLIKDATTFRHNVESLMLESIKTKKVNILNQPKEILSKFEVTEDKFDSSKFLHHKKNKSYLYLYIGQNYGNPYLRFVNKYTGNDWVFMKKIIFLVDGDKFEYYPKNIKREVFLGGLYERSDDSVSEDMFPLLNALANAKNEIEIRYEGERIHDQKYNAKSAIAIKETLDFFNSLKSQ